MEGWKLVRNVKEEKKNIYRFCNELSNDFCLEKNWKLQKICIQGDLEDILFEFSNVVKEICSV